MWPAASIPRISHLQEGGAHGGCSCTEDQPQDPCVASKNKQAFFERKDEKTYRMRKSTTDVDIIARGPSERGLPTVKVNQY